MVFSKKNGALYHNLTMLNEDVPGVPSLFTQQEPGIAQYL